MSHRPRLFLLLLACLAAPVAADELGGIAFSHGRWELACDNTRTCRAAGYGVDAYDAQAETGRVSVLLTRAGGAGQVVTGSVRFADWEEGDPQPRPPVHLWINGRDLGAVPVPASTPAMEREPLAELPATQVTALLASLRGHSSIEFIDAGGQRWPLSDEGASAVLLKMDEFQGRVGTSGALVRPGPASEARVPPALPLPRIRLAPVAATRATDAALAAEPSLRDALRTSLGADQECMGLGPGEDEAPLQVLRLSGDHVLVSTDCWRGAYNAGTGYWVVSDAAPWSPEPVTLDAVDYADGRITASQKGRGLGDCFWSAEWAWDGRRFVQTLDASSGSCEGIALGGTWSLPTRVAEVVQ